MSQWTKDTLSRITSLAVTAILVLATLHFPGARATAFNNGQPTYSLGLDPCASTGYTKQSVSISVATATTTQLVALASGQTVYLCNYQMTIGSSATTAASVQFEYGTGTTCGTGTTVLTGTMGTEQAAAGAGILLVNGPAAGSTFILPVGNALCIVTAGTTVALHGSVTYVQI